MQIIHEILFTFGCPNRNIILEEYLNVLMEFIRNYYNTFDFLVQRSVDSFSVMIREH